METMRAAVLYDVDDIRIEQRDVPALEPGDLLVRTAASGICSGDLMPWYVRRKAPFVFGHEPAGTVVATGPDASFEIGARVFAHHHAPCFQCDLCRRGDYVQCATWRSTALDPGGMAEFFRVPRLNVADTLRLPASVSFADGSLVEPLACVVKSLVRGFGAERPLAREAFAGRTLCVVGLGVMGLMHVAVAAALGAQVVGVDFIDARRVRAVALGAGAAFDPAAIPAGPAGRSAAAADVVICGPGSSAALDAALSYVMPGGTVVMFAPLEAGMRYALDQAGVYFRDLRMVASYSCGPEDTREALRLIEAGTVGAAQLEAHLVTLDQIADAYRQMAGGALVKAIVTFPG